MDPTFVQLVEFDGRLYALDHTGRVWAYNAGTRAWEFHSKHPEAE